jgi:uncharacterized repeat protein (TIGR03803 family)
MKGSRKLFLSASVAVALAIILFTTAAHAQTFTVLYNFGGIPGDPLGPGYGPIAQGRDGNLYDTSVGGGSSNFGTVFKITSTGTVTVFHDILWEEGYAPYGGLTLGRDGNFYGTTSGYGSSQSGTVFKITPDGNLGTLYAFSYENDNGGNPFAPPIQGADGDLYGTTSAYGGTGAGTIYKILPTGLITLYHFTGGADGGWPYAPLLQATDGNFYGTTSSGTIFKINSAGAFTTLASPGSAAPLIQANNSSFYGVTRLGGNFNEGTVFQMSRSGAMKVLRNLNQATGWIPTANLIEASDGNLYGVTSGGGQFLAGTIFRIRPNGDFSVLYNFSYGGASGGWPDAPLFQHTNGLLYGTAEEGPYGEGVLYSLDVGAPPFVRLVSTFGKVGTTIGILGQGFTSATDVSFNGIPATFTVSSDTYLETTVPVGATTGFVTVTTSSGTLTSNQQIQIRQ